MCDNAYPGTREGFILVVELTPSDSDNGGGSGRRETKSSSPGTAANGERRREELADFLRTKRASLQPEDVGLPDGGRRRTPGLRREEVAQLAGVGTTWYTWLEQGRDVRASLDVLEALSRALRLTPAERTHLILLGRGEEAPPCKAPAEEVSPTLRRLVENLGPDPAYMLGRRWDYLAWNGARARVRGSRDPNRAARNHMWLWFMDPARRELCSGDWATSARLLVAKFRADSARHIGDPAFEELISALAPVEPRVLQAVEAPRGRPQRRGTQGAHHPVVGPLVFEHAVFNHGEPPEQRLILYSPLRARHAGEARAAARRRARAGSGARAARSAVS